MRKWIAYFFRKRRYRKMMERLKNKEKEGTENDGENII
jgi:hypothetical protein